MKNKKYSRLAIILIVVLVAVLLIIALRQVAVRLIAMPLMRMVWLIDFLIDALPQVFFWFFVLFIAFRFAVRSLRRPRIVVNRAMVPPRVPPQGRALVWSQRLALIREGNYSKWGLCRHLTQLYVELLAQRFKISLNEARNRLRQGDYVAAPDVRAYIEAGLSSQPPAARMFLWRILERLGLRKPQALMPSLELAPTRFVQFLENQLEVLYDVEDN